jgi:hypothetical protein
MFGLYLAEFTRDTRNCRGDSANNLLASAAKPKTFWFAANEQCPKSVCMGKALAAFSHSIHLYFCNSRCCRCRINRAGAALERSGSEAGFWQGMLQGALMPMAMHAARFSLATRFGDGGGCATR